MVARLVPAELRLHKSDSEIERYAQGEGWLEVFANRARVLIAEAIAARRARRRRAASSASTTPSSASREAEEGSAAAEQAERERARAEAFIKIAENALICLLSSRPGRPRARGSSLRRSWTSGC